MAQHALLVAVDRAPLGTISINRRSHAALLRPAIAAKGLILPGREGPSHQQAYDTATRTMQALPPAVRSIRPCNDRRWAGDWWRAMRTFESGPAQVPPLSRAILDSEGTLFTSREQSAGRPRVVDAADQSVAHHHVDTAIAPARSRRAQAHRRCGPFLREPAAPGALTQNDPFVCE
jgi:hypothetical protein